MIGAGQLVWRVRIERPDASDHDQPSGAVRWLEAGRAFVRQETMRTETSESGALARIVWTLTMRANGVKAGWRLRSGSRVLMVRVVAPDGVPGLERLTCEEFVAAPD